MALRAQVIDLVGVDSFEHPPQSRAVGQIAIVQSQPGATEMRVVIEMVDAASIEETNAPHHAMYFVAFREEELGKI